MISLTHWSNTENGQTISVENDWTRSGTSGDEFGACGERYGADGAWPWSESEERLVCGIEEVVGCGSEREKGRETSVGV